MANRPPTRILYVTSLNGVILMLTLLAMTVLSYLAERVPFMAMSVIGLGVLVATLSPLAMDFQPSQRLLARSVALLAACMVFICIAQFAVLIGANSIKQRDITVAAPALSLASVAVNMLPSFRITVWSRLSSVVSLVTLLATAGLWWLQGQVSFIPLNVPMLVLITGMVIALVVRFVARRSPKTGLIAHLGWYWVGIMMMVTLASLITLEVTAYRGMLPGFTLVSILGALMIGSLSYIVKNRRK